MSRTTGRWIAAAIGGAAGVGAIAAIYKLPLVYVAGFDEEGYLSYDRTMAWTCVFFSACIAIHSLAGYFRLTTLWALIFLGIVASTDWRLYREAAEISHYAAAGSGEMAQMSSRIAAQTMAQSSLRAGAYVVPGCGLLALAASLMGWRLSRRRS